MHVKISKGNSKMGSIASVSLPAGITCRSDCLCQTKCYAKKLERIRKTVREAYRNNLELLETDPDTYWREVDASVKMSRFFRFHVSGDIPDMKYLDKMVEIARRNSKCEILCFTKKYDIVNRYIDLNHLGLRQKIPRNLHIIFSGWIGTEMDNPYSFPEAHVRFKDGTTTARKDAKECSGNCTECAMAGGGCWSLRYGEQVVFDEH